MHRVGLIASREIAAYAALPSFWLAMIIGPVLMLLVGLFAGQPAADPAPPAHVVAIIADEDHGRAATLALDEAGRLTGAPLVVAEGAAANRVRTHLEIHRNASGDTTATVRGEPLPPVALALLERDLAAPPSAPRAMIKLEPLRQAGEPQAQAFDPDSVGRFALTMLLWLNLTGSLGMLLQAVVRERANRALEILLASTRPWEIVAGKLIGVGALSTLVLAIWLGSGALVAQGALGGADQGGGHLVLAAFTRPADLALAACVYVMAFAMYGAAMIGVGALAKDLPAAQNLSRPVFAVLLVVFFATLGQVMGMAGPPQGWLLFAPPSAPFMALMAPPQSLSAMDYLMVFGGMAAATMLALVFASFALTGRNPLSRWRKSYAPAAHQA